MDFNSIFLYRMYGNSLLITTIRDMCASNEHFDKQSPNVQLNYCFKFWLLNLNKAKFYLNKL